MKDPDLTYYLNKARDGWYHLGRASYYLGIISSNEGGHYIDEALEHIRKVKDMLNRYREFIKEDDNSTRTSIKDDDDDDYYDYI